MDVFGDPFTGDSRGENDNIAWLTGLRVQAKTVEAVVWQGGRARWKIENQGFNRQKNSGWNLPHLYSTDPEKLKAYYCLLQIAFILLQFLEQGSLLRRLAAERGRTPWQFLGGMMNVAWLLLESLRRDAWVACWFEGRGLAGIHVSFQPSTGRSARAVSALRVGRSGWGRTVWGVGQVGRATWPSSVHLQERQTTLASAAPQPPPTYCSALQALAGR